MLHSFLCNSFVHFVGNCPRWRVMTRCNSSHSLLNWLILHFSPCRLPITSIDLPLCRQVKCQLRLSSLRHAAFPFHSSESTLWWLPLCRLYLSLAVFFGEKKDHLFGALALETDGRHTNTPPHSSTTWPEFSPDFSDVAHSFNLMSSFMANISRESLHLGIWRIVFYRCLLHLRTNLGIALVF